MSSDLRIETRRQTMAQVIVCLGCCCGRVERGNPPVPVDWLKSEWRRNGLLKHVHLTVSGCLGPCDLVNVVCLLGSGWGVWLGGLDRPCQYEAILDWALLMVKEERVVPLPSILASHEFMRFKAASETAVQDHHLEVEERGSR